MERPDQLVDIVHQVALWSLPILAAVIFHEVAHGMVAFASVTTPRSASDA